MKLGLTGSQIKALSEASNRFRRDYEDGTNTASVTVESLPRACLAVLAKDDTLDKRQRAVIQLILDTRLTFKDLPEIERVTRATAEVNAFVQRVMYKWFFTIGDHGELYPYVFSGSAYTPPRPRKTDEDSYPAYVTLELSYVSMMFGAQATSITEFDERFLEEKPSALDLFIDRGYVPCTEELFKVYVAQVARFYSMYNNYGSQYVSKKLESMYYRSWWRRDADDSVDDAPKFRRSKENVIVGVSGTRQVIMCSYEISARGKTQAENAAPLSGEARFPFNKNEPTPYHLLLKVFDLEGNAYKYSHPVALSRYKYRNATLDHLVASNEVKKLISILTSGAASIRSDIVEDKGMGRILMLTGMPGTGKTLTAEIVADSSKKPLLRIKSATLGTTVDSVERNLTLIMRRAEAWDCIVLFDEADVFIQKRGDSLEKNALVGVFLQILEYCNTTVFMTTNREHDIDDAIVSRCDALINFGMPDESQRKTLWLRHAEIAGVKLPDGIVNSLSKEFRVTGRTIKKCVALAKRIADAENATPSEKTMTRVMRFVPGGPLSSHVNREFNAEELLGNLSKDQLEEVQEYLDRKGP